jgi:hypothetical protein
MLAMMLVRVRRLPPSPWLWLALLLAAAARMPFWLASTHALGHGDAIIWQVWAKAIHEHGFLDVLRTTDTNNIGYHYVLWPTGAIYAWLFSPEFELWTAPIRVLVKIPPFLCDLGLVALIFAIARRLSRAATGAARDAQGGAAALAFGLAPATVYDSMWWSQIDSVITLTSLGALMLAWRGNAGWAWALWTVGFLFKPQPIVLLPVLVMVTQWRFGWRATARGAAAAAAVALLALAPFLLHGDAARIVDVYERLFAQGPIDLVQGAWNGWSILDARAGDPVPADALATFGGVELTYARLSLALSALAAVVVAAYLRRHLTPEGMLLAAAAMTFTFYMVPTSTHERYLYGAFAFAAPLLVLSPRLIPGYTLLAATFFLNLLAINPPNADGVWQWHGTDFAVAVAGLHLALYCACMAWLAAAALPLRGRTAVPAGLSAARARGVAETAAGSQRPERDNGTGGGTDGRHLRGVAAEPGAGAERALAARGLGHDAGAREPQGARGRAAAGVQPEPLHPLAGPVDQRAVPARADAVGERRLGGEDRRDGGPAGARGDGRGDGADPHRRL